MSEFNIEVQGGSSVRLPTAGKYCEQDIIVTAKGGNTGGTEELENLIDESGVLGTTDETATAKEKVNLLIDKAKLLDELRGFSFVNNTTIETIGYYFDTPTNIYNDTFSGTSALKKIKGFNTSKTTRLTNTFNRSAVEIIEKPFDLSSLQEGSYNHTFMHAKFLIEIRIVPDTIPCSITFSSEKLSVESAKSIILGLKNYENDNINGYNYTLTLDEAVWVKLDAEEGIEAPDGTIVGWRDYVEFNLWWNT